MILKNHPDSNSNWCGSFAQNFERNMNKNATEKYYGNRNRNKTTTNKIMNAEMLKPMVFAHFLLNMPLFFAHFFLWILFLVKKRIIHWANLDFLCFFLFFFFWIFIHWIHYFINLLPHISFHCSVLQSLRFWSCFSFPF